MDDGKIEDFEAREQLRKSLRDSKEYREQYATIALIENVSAQVQALRRQRGLTQEQLAQRIGTKQPRISNIEVPPESDGVPNWEVDTLNRIAQALDTRLKISFETYGSLLDELESVDSDSLRRPDVDTDILLNPRPPVPEADKDAPERTRWMQQHMIPWLWNDKLGLETLIGWLQGYGLPPVGHDEEASQWLLRGIPERVGPEIRDYMERQLAERLAVVLGEQPDLQPLVAEREEEFLINLYSTCAGLTRPEFLFDPLWQAYKRLRVSKLNGVCRDALQAALIRNQEGEKPLKEIWAPMVERGRQRWLRGGEMVGYQGIVARRTDGKPEFDKIFWALRTISHRWTGTPDDKRAFKRMMEGCPDQQKLIQEVELERLSLSAWARDLLPKIVKRKAGDGSIGIVVSQEGTEVHADWPVQAKARVIMTGPAGEHREDLETSGPPREKILLNFVTRFLGDYASELVPDVELMHAACLANLQRREPAPLRT